MKIERNEHNHESINTPNNMAQMACRLVNVGSWYVDVVTMQSKWSNETFFIHDLEIGEVPSRKQYMDMLLGASKQQFQQALTAMMHQAQPYDLELEILTQKGRHKWIRSIGHPVVEHGVVVGIEGAVQDITVMRSAIIQAQNKESIVESFFDVTPDLYFIIDFDGTIRDYKAQKESLLYAHPEQFIDKRVADILPYNAVQSFESSLQQVRTTNTVAHYGYELQLEDGLHYFEGHLSILPNRQQCLSVVRDITEQHLVLQALEESEARYRSLLEEAPFPIIISRLDNGCIRYSNTRAKEQFSIKEDGNNVQHASTLYQNVADREQLLSALRKHSHVRDLELQMIDAEGQLYWVLMSASIIQFEGEPAIMGSINNISARKQAEEALRVSEEKYRLLTEYTSDVIWVLNLTQEKFTYISPTIEQLRGFTAQEALAQTLEESLTPESAKLVKDMVTAGLDEFINTPENAKTYIVEVQQPCKNGELVWVEISTKYRFNKNNDIEVFGVSRNIEDRKKMEQKVMYLSYHDQLTGLYNRRYYEEYIQQLSDKSLPLTFIIADINGLKLTNDAFGHLIGDQLFTTFAEVVQEHVKENDIVARVGGDEFIILMPKTESSQAEEIVKCIKKSIAQRKIGKVRLSVSFGLKTKDSPEQDFELIYKEAEDNMYRHKLLEGNTFKNNTVKTIKKMLYQQYPQEKAHSERVSELCKSIGRALDLHEEVVSELGVAGLLHDIGKIGIDENIINKSTALTEDEWKAIQRHPEIGYQILRSVVEFTSIAEAVLKHHERPDGKGYPKGLKDAAIPSMAKILAVAEAYDDMTSIRHYKEVFTSSQAIQQLQAGAGSQFDERIVQVFVDKVLTSQ